MTMHSGLRALLATTVPVAVAGVLLGSAAPASAAAGTGVSLTPSSVMPYITSAKSNVAQLVQCGSTMYAVGTFTQVGRPGGLRYDRTNAFSFNATTGAVTSWNPRPNGAVASVALSSNCADVYLAGSFTSIGGAARPGLAKVSGSSGAVDTAFRPAPNKAVFTVVVKGGLLLAGGPFTSIGGAARTRMASLNQTTGAATSYLRLSVTGAIPGNSGVTRIDKFRLSPDGRRMLATGNFSAIAGHGRSQLFVIYLGRGAAILDPWYSPNLNQACDAQKSPFYVRAATWSPDATRIFIATTGGSYGKSPLCDAAAAFSSAGRSNHAPLWINKTGCDSLYAVAADTKAVYIGGHERYIDNPNACNKQGPGASRRQGIGAIAPATGHSVAWNPSRARGHGADDMLRTPAGLWVASDTYLNATSCGGHYHPGICFFPNG